MAEYKTCTRCGETKPLDEFYTDSRARDGHQARCKVCQLAQKRQSDREHPGRKQAWDRKGHLKYRYDITLAEYDEMLVAQGGVCALCGRVNADGNRLSVDHNHETGEIRGLLCRSCNRGIGSIAETPEQLQRLIDYLRRD